jgi:hypothetical protein
MEMDPNNISNQDSYNNLESELFDLYSAQNDMKNLSQVEYSKNESEKDPKNFEQNNNESTNRCDDNDDSEYEEEEIDVNKIILISLENENSLNILKYECYIARFLRSIIKDIDDLDNNINKFISMLEWMLNASNILIKKSGQYEYKYNKYSQSVNPKTGKPKIIRSSYKFCEKAHDCCYFYEKNKYSGCSSQHYVHNIVKNDINSLYEYFKWFNEERKNIRIDTIDNDDLIEINKSMNTIFYVVTKMYNELFYVDHYSSGKSEELHKVSHLKKNDNKNVKNVKNFTSNRQYNNKKVTNMDKSINNDGKISSITRSIDSNSNVDEWVRVSRTNNKYAKKKY